MCSRILKTTVSSKATWLLAIFCIVALTVWPSRYSVLYARMPGQAQVSPAAPQQGANSAQIRTDISSPPSQASASAPPSTYAPGIYVDRPKVYDQASLLALISSLQQNLTSLNPFVAQNLTNGLGTMQGAVANQAQNSFQLNYGGSPTAPAAPSLPNAPAFALPTAFSPSSADIFSEETQLGFQIVSLELLLEGARSDQVEPNTNQPRTMVTLGFPVSINVPQGYKYQNAVAEVEVSICAPGDTPEESKTPRLVTIIPEAKTYNVAGLVNKSTQVSGGAIAQVFSFGGSFLRGHQTYYLMQDQDTLAFQKRSAATCIPHAAASGPTNSLGSAESASSAASKPTTSEAKPYPALTFGWQFKPVLGEKVVRDGLRQTFVQVSFAPWNVAPSHVDQSIEVRTRWRTYDRKTGRVGAFLPTDGDATFPEYNYNTPPQASGISASDNGDGTLTVKATGDFKTGTYVRIGSLLLKPPVPQTTSSISNAPGNGQASGNAATGNVQAGGGVSSAVSNGSGGGQNSTTQTASTAGSQASSPAPGTPAANASQSNTTSLQIQATLQLPAGAQNSTGGSGSSPAANSTGTVTPQPATLVAVTPAFVLFTAPAASIAANGAFLVDPDGLESPLVACDTTKTSAACLQAESRQGTISPTVLYQEKALSYFATRFTTALANPSSDIEVSPYSDSSSLVTLKKIPQFSPAYTGAPDLPVVRIGSTVFGLRDQPFLSYQKAVKQDGGTATLLVPNSILHNEAKTGNQIVWEQLFASADSSAPKIYIIPEVASAGSSESQNACAISSSSPPVFLSSTGSGAAGTSNYAIFGTHLETLTAHSVNDPHDILDTASESAVRILTVPSAYVRSGGSIVVDCGNTPLPISLPAPPSGNAASNPKETLNPAGGHASLNATSVQISGTGLDHLTQVLYGAKPLQFVPVAADGSAVNIIQLTPNDPQNPTSSAGSKSLLFIFADQTTQTYLLTVP